MPKSLFCFGYGYTCEALANELKKAGGWTISGTTRDSEKFNSLKNSFVTPYLFDYFTPIDEIGDMLNSTTHVLISTPPDEKGDPTCQVHGRDIAELPNLEWVGYLSSTSVYGDRQGGWVNESTPPEPSSKRGSRRYRAERQWQNLAVEQGLPLNIFRLSGIYGPRRSALDSVRAGTARRIDKPGHAFNRIHIDDIVQVLMASMMQPTENEIFNLSDDEAAPSHEVIAYACKLLGMPLPRLMPYEEADLAPITRSFYEDNKRIENHKIKDMLGVTLKYPNHRAGLEACLAAEKKSPIKLRQM